MVKTHPTTSNQYTHTLPLERGIAFAQLHSATSGSDWEKYQSPWLKGEGWRRIVKTHTTTSPQYSFTLPLEGGIDVAQLHSSFDWPNGEKYQSPWLEGEVWSKLIPQHPSSKLTHSPFEGA
jgi:hypothetical protein